MRRKKIKMKTAGVNKSVLNTTIKTDVLDEFKEISNEIGIPMGYLIEAFMRDFNDGKFRVGIGSGGRRKREIRLDLDD